MLIASPFRRKWRRQTARLTLANFHKARLTLANFHKARLTLANLHTVRLTLADSMQRVALAIRRGHARQFR
jgi:uncharacterized protein YjbI with pentapeptide repeats